MSSMDAQVGVCDMAESAVSSDMPCEVVPAPETKTLPAEDPEAPAEDIKTSSAENEVPSLTTEVANTENEVPPVNKLQSAENDALPKDTDVPATKNETPSIGAESVDTVSSSVFTKTPSSQTPPATEDEAPSVRAEVLSEAQKALTKENKAPTVGTETGTTENQTSFPETAAPISTEVQAPEPVSDAPSSEGTEEEVVDNQK